MQASTTSVRRPFVSVYIPCHNYGHYLKEAIQSVFDQTFHDWELFIIDDGSSDESYVIAQELLNSFSGDQRIEIIKNRVTIGLASTANLILGKCRGKYLFRLDADDKISKYCFELGHSSHKKSPQFDALVTDFFLIDRDSNIIGFDSQASSSSLNTNKSPYVPHGACSFLSVKRLKAKKGYRVGYGAQDGWDVWTRVFCDIPVLHISQPLFYYRKHGTSLSDSAQRIYAARAQIVQKSVESTAGDYRNNILAVIPVKSFGSSGDKSHTKNLERVMTMCESSSLITSILVSSSSTSLEGIVEHCKSLTPTKKLFSSKRLHMAEPGKGVPVSNILRDAVSVVENSGESPDIVVFLNINHQFDSGEEIDNGINQLLSASGDCLISIRAETQPVFSWSLTGLQLINPGRLMDIGIKSQDVFVHDGKMIACWTASIESPAGIFSGSIVPFEG